jgi:hypothetical protein
MLTTEKRKSEKGFRTLFRLGAACGLSVFFLILVFFVLFVMAKYFSISPDYLNEHADHPDKLHLEDRSFLRSQHLQTHPKSQWRLSHAPPDKSGKGMKPKPKDTRTSVQKLEADFLIITPKADTNDSLSLKGSSRAKLKKMLQSPLPDGTIVADVSEMDTYRVRVNRLGGKDYTFQNNQLSEEKPPPPSPPDDGRPLTMSQQVALAHKQQKQQNSNQKNSQAQKEIDLLYEKLHPKRTDYSYSFEETHWSKLMAEKLACLSNKKLSFYFYHVRKAAGTTIRDMFRLLAFKFRIPFYETEGIVLNQNMLNKKEVMAVISLRNPIERIMSLYWYEHVSWFYSVKKRANETHPMDEWVEAWSDSNDYKLNILKRYPWNNYMEINNYYTKLLISYVPDVKEKDGSTLVEYGPLNKNEKLTAKQLAALTPSQRKSLVGSIDYNNRVVTMKNLTRADLEKAKEILSQFDMILISEWIRNPDRATADALSNQMDDEEGIGGNQKALTGSELQYQTLNAFYQMLLGTPNSKIKLTFPQKVKGDLNLKSTLKSQLVKNEVRQSNAIWF